MNFILFFHVFVSLIALGHFDLYSYGFLQTPKEALLNSTVNKQTVKIERVGVQDAVHSSENKNKTITSPLKVNLDQVNANAEKKSASSANETFKPFVNLKPSLDINYKKPEEKNLTTLLRSVGEKNRNFTVNETGSVQTTNNSKLDAIVKTKVGEVVGSVHDIKGQTNAQAGQASASFNKSRGALAATTSNSSSLALKSNSSSSAEASGISRNNAAIPVTITKQDNVTISGNTSTGNKEAKPNFKLNNENFAGAGNDLGVTFNNVSSGKNSTNASYGFQAIETIKDLNRGISSAIGILLTGNNKKPQLVVEKPASVPALGGKTGMPLSGNGNITSNHTEKMVTGTANLQQKIK